MASNPPASSPAIVRVTVHDVARAAGVSIGTVSSIYVASALALKLGMKREHMLQQKVEKEGADQPSILP